MKQKNTVLEYGLYLFIFLLPLQTRWIVSQGMIQGGPWEYGTLSMYVTEVLLIFLLIFGLLSHVKNRSRKITTRSRRLLPYYFALIGLLLWSFVSIVWSSDSTIAFHSWIRLCEGIGLAFLLIHTNVSHRGVGWAFVASGVVQGALGIYQFVTQTIFGSTILGMSQQISHQAGASVIQSESLRWLRAYGSLPHPNMLAAFLAIALIIGLILIFTSSSYAERAALWGSQVVMLGGLFFTFSKAGILALALGLAVILIFILLIKDYEGKLIFSQFIFVVLTVLGLLSIVFSDPVLTRLYGQQPLEQQSVSERVDLLNDARQLITSHLFIGAGIGNYTVALQQLKPGLHFWEYQPVHNVYLLILTELGIIGALFFIFFFIDTIKAIYNYKIDYQIEMMELFKEEDRDSLDLYSEYSFSVHWFIGFAAIFLMIVFLFFFDHFFWTLYFGVMLFWIAIGLLLREISYMKK